ncbi:hypothetical protein PMIN06_010863 [Paraphaeosphaeria minitans]
MRTQTIAAVVGAALLHSADAYSNNCKGSLVGLNESLKDCYNGLNRVDRGAQYSDQTQFSSGHCYIIYATNGAGAQPVSGQTIVDTATSILTDCGGIVHLSEGSYGTGNCESCHVTVNYRS